jgi:hypothetical protein
MPHSSARTDRSNARALVSKSCSVVTALRKDNTRLTKELAACNAALQLTELKLAASNSANSLLKKKMAQAVSYNNRRMQDIAEEKAMVKGAEVEVKKEKVDVSALGDNIDEFKEEKVDVSAPGDNLDEFKEESPVTFKVEVEKVDRSAVTGEVVIHCTAVLVETL